MADIIPLEPHRRPAAADAPRPDKPAAIVIFPGVRYERPHDGPADTASPRRRPTKAN